MVAGGFLVDTVVGFDFGLLVVDVVLGLDVLGLGVVVVVVVVGAALLVVDGRLVVVVVVGLPVVLGLTVDVLVARGALITRGLADSGRRGVDW